MAATGGMVPAGATMWARRDLRRRWRALVVLGVLAGLSAGLAMAAAAGARRTDTAFGRLRKQTHGADAVVFPGQVGARVTDWSKLRREPYVEAVAPWSLLFGNVDGQPNLLFGPLDDTWLQRVDRPVVIAGRMFDPRNPDEVVVDEGAAADAPLGSVHTFQPYVDGHSDLDRQPPTGPVLHLKVVGVVRETSEFLFSAGFVFPSPALLRDQHRITHIENAHVRLRHPATDMARLKRDAPRILAKGTPVLDLHQVETRVSTAIAVERSALLLLALAVAAAGFVFVGQAASRSLATIDAEADTLRAMGFTRRELAIAATAPHLIVAALGAAGGLAVALALSPRFPIGYAARVDPGKGFNADWVVLGPATLATAALLAGGSLLSSWWHQRRRDRDAPPRPPLVARLARVRPITVGLGATMALDPGRGRRTIPARPALIGAIAAVLGLTATLTIRHGLDQALADPARVGVTWDAAVSYSTPAVFDLKQPDRLRVGQRRLVTADPDASGVSAVWRSVDKVDDVGVAVFAVDRIRGDVDLVTVAGRAPRADDEVAVGPATMRQLHVDIGDRITIGGRRLRVVGRSLFPVDVHSGFDEGVWATRSTLFAVSPPTDLDTGDGPYPTFAVRWRPGVDHDAALARLHQRMTAAADVSAAEIPAELQNLRNVRTVPAVLAGFVVLLGLTTLAHLLVAAVRSRRLDFAVYRAVGFSRRMCAAVIGTQATVVAAVGLVIGLPLGFVVGREAWAWLSARVPMVYVSPLWLVVVAVVAPIAFLVTWVIAAWPARRAGRLLPAEIFRAE